ncbi:MAG: hypothetical protein WDW38_006522 [Sanguina aurantia]
MTTTINAALLVAHGRKTIQPEDFAALAKLHSMFSAPLAPKSRSSRQRPRSRSMGMTGGDNVSTGSYFNTADSVDRAAYLSAADQDAGGHGGSTSDLMPDYARSALDYYALSPVTPSLTGGASKGKARSSKSATRWSLPSESVTRVLREYRLRFNTDVRMTGAAKLYLRAAIKSNIDAVLDATRTSSKGVRLTSSALKRASDGHVLVLT